MIKKTDRIRCRFDRCVALGSGATEQAGQPGHAGQQGGAFPGGEGAQVLVGLAQSLGQGDADVPVDGGHQLGPRLGLFVDTGAGQEQDLGVVSGGGDLGRAWFAVQEREFTQELSGFEGLDEAAELDLGLSGPDDEERRAGVTLQHDRFALVEGLSFGEPGEDVALLEWVDACQKFGREHGLLLSRQVA